MDWMEKVNQAIGYVENHLTEEIDPEEISRITLCPAALFQRFFVLAAGITLTEYIRRRRLSCAARDLVKTSKKVIDLAYQYGYESPDAFCVAFKRQYGVTPSQARKSGRELPPYHRLFFTLKITHIKEDNAMVLLGLDKYRYYDPLFEGGRIILSYLGETYSPEYIQGISGSAFKIAGGCPSRPTCICDRWTPDFFRALGFEVRELPCVDEAGRDVTGEMLEGVKNQLDAGRPALVWHAFTNAEWDVVCGYDAEEKQFIGRGTYRGGEDYCREAWDRAGTCDVAPACGAILIGPRTGAFDRRAAEIGSLLRAVRHARKEPENGDYAEGIAFYYHWAAAYGQPGRERSVDDAYCYDVYSSVRRAAVIYLREIAHRYGGGILENLQMAAGCFEQECETLARARPYLSWESPWGVDEERSRQVAPLLLEAAQRYEAGIQYIEKALAAFPGDITPYGEI